jgi:hypothetical protein
MSTGRREPKGTTAMIYAVTAFVTALPVSVTVIADRIARR